MKIINEVNKNFFDKLKIDIDTIVPIKFTTDDMGIDGGNYGGSKHSMPHKCSIQLNPKIYLFTDNNQIVDPDTIKFDLKNILEHELIHAEQHKRSNKPLGIWLSTKTEDKEKTNIIMHMMMSQKWDVTTANEKYKYYNDTMELMPWAKTASRLYMERTINHIKSQYPHISFNPDEFKNLVKSAFKAQLWVNWLKNHFTVFKFLTTNNKKRFIKYFISFIEHQKYEPIIGTCKKCGNPLQPNIQRCPKCNTPTGFNIANPLPSLPNISPNNIFTQ